MSIVLMVIGLWLIVKGVDVFFAGLGKAAGLSDDDPGHSL